ncbi:MAG: glycogen synthase [Anaerolineaceae bacterium]
MNSDNLKKHLRVLFVAAEAEPFVKIGGLGDVAGSLPLAVRSIPPSILRGRQIDARLIIPFHPVISRENFKTEKVISFFVPTLTGRIKADVYQIILQGMPVYLVDGRPVREAKSVYSQNTLQDGDKFVFFCKAVLEFSAQFAWTPQILHTNDWHTAVIPYLLKSFPEKYPTLSSMRTMLTIHNLPFMGAGIEKSLKKYGIKPSENPDLPQWSRFFPLPMGLSAVDRITAVSPHYTSELFTEGFGCGLQTFMETIRFKISGVLNGIDTHTWNPATDHLIAHPFTKESLAARAGNRQTLIREFQLDPDPTIPLMTFIGRMDIQKGIDLLLEALPGMNDQPWQAIIIGTGSEELEKKCRDLETRYPDRIRAVIRFDSALSHRLYAGADMIIIPSRYEPCGLVQMIAMRYGCVPVASAVGGLVDTIIDHPNKEESTGFLFTPPVASSLKTALSRAITSYSQNTIWKRIQSNGMSKDFSWTTSAREYAQQYLNEYQANT